ncbi:MULTISPECIES: cell division protein ZapA [Neptunomonas]|uniref:Cell division protein ZapA n=1 Tax=Neptunomonas marina TaxID=1815562 RepID=A0A437Q5J2_9GAMM|nr:MULTISPECIES: cell division protein ZapA [Neptunomonas]RVU29769.1 cell division protein ZapA [Neptunomonas marina]
MSNESGHKVAIKLMDKEYVVGCPDGAEAELFASADLLDKKMREIRDSGKVLGLERVAVMAALNLSHELLKSKEEQREHIETRIQRLGAKIDSSLEKLAKTQPEDLSSSS